MVFVMLLSPLPLRAEEVNLNLDEAIAIALRNNPNMLLKAEDINKAKYKISEAHAILFPSVNLTGAYSYTQGFYTGKVSDFTTQTSVKQYLYRGGKTQNTIKQNEYLLSVAEAILDKTKLEMIFGVQKAFCALLLAKDLAEVNKKILENTQKHLDTLKTRYKNGEASESDIISIESSLATVQQAFDESLNQFESGQNILVNLLSLDKDVKINPQGGFSYEPADIAYEEALLKAIENRPEIKQYQAQENADKRSIEIAKADNRPSIYAAWDYFTQSHKSSSSATPQNNWNNHNVIGVVLTWPIFDGWATKARVEQAMVDLKETQLLQKKAQEDIALEVKNTYLDLKNAIDKIKASDSDLKVYEDNLSKIKIRYQKGMTSALDLNDAEVKYNVSLFNKNQAVYDYIVSKYNFDKATGGI